MGEQLVQGRYVVALGRFEPATLRLQGTKQTSTPPRPIRRARMGRGCCGACINPDYLKSRYKCPRFSTVNVYGFPTAEPESTKCRNSEALALQKPC